MDLIRDSVAVVNADANGLQERSVPMPAQLRGPAQQRAEDLIEKCRAHGLRVTGQRRILVALIAEASDHPDVQALHRRALIVDPTLSLSTVYRTLKQLTDIGAIAQHSFDGQRVRVESAPLEHHDHLVDVSTGRIIEFTSPEIEALQIEVARHLGFELTGHRLELYGRPLDEAGRKGRARGKKR